MMDYNYHNVMGGHVNYRNITCRLFAVPVLLVMVASPLDLRSEDSSFFSVAMSYIDKTVASLSTRLSGEAKEKTEKTTVATDPEDIAIRAALDGLMRTMFLEEKGRHFTQSKWGAKSTPYQMAGIQTIKLDESSLNESDRAAGIEKRVTFEIKVREFRQYEEKVGWGSWTKGNPPHLDSVTLVRQSGSWKVSVSPLWAYSLK